MTDSRSVIRLFIASPSDTSHLRDAVDRVVSEVNKTVAPSFGFTIEITRWEDVVPRMGDAEKIILEDAELENTDLLVGILWNRFGSPTREHDSGTEEEFEYAYKFWEQNGHPEILFYFCQEAKNMTSTQELQQKRKVIEFRNRIQKLGLVSDFDKSEDFEPIFRGHLMRHLASISDVPSTERSQAEETVYSEVTDLVARTQSQSTSLAECLAQGLSIARRIEDHSLSDFCRRELAGWDEDEFRSYPDEEMSYRIVDCFWSFHKINLSSPLWSNIHDVFSYMESDTDNFTSYRLAIIRPVSWLESQGEQDPNSQLAMVTTTLGNMMPESKDADMTVYLYLRANSHQKVIQAIREKLTEKLTEKLISLLA